jgi:hypothetical protein
MVVRPKHIADNLNQIVNNYCNRVALDGNPWFRRIFGPKTDEIIVDWRDCVIGDIIISTGLQILMNGEENGM